MTVLDLLAVSAPTRLDPIELFLDADIVVQLVIVGLVLASVWVWAIIIGFTLRMGRTRRNCDAFEEDFWRHEDRPIDRVPARTANSIISPNAVPKSNDVTSTSKKASSITREPTKPIAASVSGVALGRRDRATRTAQEVRTSGPASRPRAGPAKLARAYSTRATNGAVVANSTAT